MCPYSNRPCAIFLGFSTPTEKIPDGFSILGMENPRDFVLGWFVTGLIVVKSFIGQNTTIKRLVLSELCQKDQNVLSSYQQIKWYEK